MLQGTHSKTDVDTHSVRAQIDLILASDAFSRSSRMQRFLRFIVEERLAGRGDEIGEYSIGLAVFDRGDDFEPAIDPIVRNDARRLRSKLLEYYRPENRRREDIVFIDIPKGGYVPAFRALRAGDGVPARIDAGARRLAVLPFDVLSADPECVTYCHALCLTLTAALTAIRDVEAIAHAFVRDRPLNEAASELRLSHVIHGSVLKSGRRYQAIINLVQSPDGKQLWAREYDFEPAGMLNSQSEIVAGVLREVKSCLSEESEPGRSLYLAA